MSLTTLPAYDTLMDRIEHHVRELFRQYQKPQLVYHNLEHTETVVLRAMEIAEGEQLGAEDRFHLFAAAWFHDTGHLFTAPKHHEEASLQIANTFLDSIPGVTQAMFAHIERCILSTKMPQVPCTPIEHIICDADTYHFGTADFVEINERVKEEAALLGADTRDWNQKTLELMRYHTFHTAFGRDVLQKGKLENMVLLARLIA